MNNDFPDFKDLEKSSSFFYKFCCDLDKQAQTFVFSKEPIAGLTAKQQARLKSEIVKFIDSTFELSNIFADMSDRQRKKS
jgi:hypothetical protein